MHFLILLIFLITPCPHHWIGAKSIYDIWCSFSVYYVLNFNFYSLFIFLKMSQKQLSMNIENFPLRKVAEFERRRYNTDPKRYINQFCLVWSSQYPSRDRKQSQIHVTALQSNLYLGSTSLGISPTITNSFDLMNVYS